MFDRVLNTLLYIQKKLDTYVVLVKIDVQKNYGRYDCTKIKFFIKNFFSKSEQIRRKLRVWSQILKKY